MKKGDTYGVHWRFCACGCEGVIYLRPGRKKLAKWIKNHNHRKQKIKKVDGCWVWQLKTDPSGQPLMRRPNRYYRVNARRVYYEAFKQVKLGSKILKVTCGNKKCVNPDHARVTTRAEDLSETNRRRSVGTKES